MSPAFTVATEATDSPDRPGLVVSVKFAAVAPTSNAALVSATVTVAPFKVASASVAGELIAAVGVTTSTVNVSVSWSPEPTTESESETVMVTVTGATVSAVGAPHTVRAVAQVGVPSARPAGSPFAA